MPELLAALDAFLQEHRRCGELDGGVEDDRVWMACDCGAVIPTESSPLATAHSLRGFERVVAAVTR